MLNVSRASGEPYFARSSAVVMNSAYSELHCTEQPASTPADSLDPDHQHNGQENDRDGTGVVHRVTHLFTYARTGPEYPHATAFFMTFASTAVDNSSMRGWVAFLLLAGAAYAD
jgi:hypothetical protein